MAGTTYGVSSDLTGEAYAAVRAIWDELEQHYGLRAAQAAVQPHLTYVVGECRQPQRLPPALAEAAATLQPIDIAIDGIGTFDGPTNVVFLRVARTAALIDVYHAVRRAMEAGGLAIWPHYQEASWTPHITLALRDLQPELVPLVLADLGRRRTRFVSRLEVLNLVHVIQPQHAYLTTLPLGA